MNEAIHLITEKGTPMDKLPLQKPHPYRLLFTALLVPAVCAFLLTFAMYRIDNSWQMTIALIFIISLWSWVLYIVLKSVKEWKMKYWQRYPKVVHLHEELPIKPNTAFLIATKSIILYILLFGYLTVVLGFALVYDALNITTANGLLNNIYFSLTTMTTVGYGDFVPMAGGRFFANVEMIFGVIYQIIAIGAGTGYLIRYTDEDNHIIE